MVPNRLVEEAFGQERYVKEFGSKGEVRLRFRLKTVSARLLGDKERWFCCVRMVDVMHQDIMLCLFVESLVVMEEDYWIRLKGLKSGCQNGETKVMKVELV